MRRHPLHLLLLLWLARAHAKAKPNTELQGEVPAREKLKIDGAEVKSAPAHSLNSRILPRRTCSFMEVRG